MLDPVGGHPRPSKADVQSAELLSPTYTTYRTSFATGSGEEASFSSFQRDVSPVRSAVESVAYIADHLRNEEEDKQVRAPSLSPVSSPLQVVEDWKYVSVVLDRIFLLLFTCACALGTAVIILRAPSIYDTTKPKA